MTETSSIAQLDETWRPNCHFTAASGFINDPNGLIYLDGIYHAFYQHNPHDTVHGPMHWGHAVSEDLVHWKELPIALYPDELGQCFSGSAVETTEGQVALLYTAHLDRQNQEPLQTQCLVHANRELTQFDSAAGNPVLENPGELKDFRDPKVFWHSATSAWIMLITHGRHVGIYRSPDLLQWQLASEFGHGLGAPGDGAWECPDLLEMPYVDGNLRWVLIAGVWSGGPGGGTGTQYFLGEFDGYQFQQDASAANTCWLDHGRDFYAFQSFSGRDGHVPRALAWFSNWQYANDTPTSRFRGALTLPRDLHLVNTPFGQRLQQTIPDAVRDAFPLHDSDDQPSGAVYRLSRTLELSAGQQLEICLFGDSIPSFIIEHAQTDHRYRLRLYRDSVVGNGQRLDAFGISREVELSVATQSPLEIELFVDNGLVELFLFDGIDVATMSFYPVNPSGAVSITTRGPSRS